MEQEQQALAMFADHGDEPRHWKNALCLAVPDKKQIEALRRAGRYLIAVEEANTKKTQHRLTKDQLSQLKERHIPGYRQSRRQI